MLMNRNAHELIRKKKAQSDELEHELEELEYGEQSSLDQGLPEDLARISVLSLSGRPLVSIPLSDSLLVGQVTQTLRDSLQLPPSVNMVIDLQYSQSLEDKSIKEFLNEEKQMFIRLSENNWIPSKISNSAQVKKVSPNVGLTRGGEKVVIEGINFLSSQIKCRFGSTDMNGQFVSDKEIHCFTPPHAPGPVSLEISFDGHNFTQDNVIFTFIGLHPDAYLVPVCVTSAVPSSITLAASCQQKEKVFIEDRSFF